jgi:hypothetical protein
MSLYAPVNYLLYRICEAAWSLERWEDSKRIVIMNIMEMLRFHERLGLSWLDFDNLRFLYPDEGLGDFWAKIGQERRRAEDTLAHMRDHVDGIVICHVSPGFDIKPLRSHWYR